MFRTVFQPPARHKYALKLQGVVNERLDPHCDPPYNG